MVIISTLTSLKDDILGKGTDDGGTVGDTKSHISNFTTKRQRSLNIPHISPNCMQTELHNCMQTEFV